MQITLNKSTGLKPNLRPAPVKSAPLNTNNRAAPKRNATSRGAPLFALFIVGALIWGWLNRGVYLTAESGLGYYLGIAGGLSMLALLAYPLRKHVRWFRTAGPVSFWFRLHMALGLIGPTLILYHSNFGLGSTNSNVALWSMLIVAGSGLIGRYFYTKIHRGLYGKRAELRELITEASQFRQTLDDDIGGDMKARIDALEKKAFDAPKGMADAAAKAFIVTAQARRLHTQLRQKLKKELNAAQKNRNAAVIAAYRAHLSFSARYFRRVEQAAELSLYERLFAAWHILHLPLFFLLIITASIHVVAVHLY